MKKRLFALGLILALLLTMVAPAAALAAKPVPFAAGGTISSISPGTVLPAGASDRWRVVEREITGTLAGDLSGQFTLTYRANIESVLTQAGSFHGEMETGTNLLVVNGQSQPLEFVQYVEVAPGIVVPTYKLTMGGKWAFLDGANGQGDFAAWAIFIPTAEGHVGTIIASAITVTGQWQP